MAGSAEERRYADARRAMLRFLDGPQTGIARVHGIGPVRHASLFNRALRTGDREPTATASTNLASTGVDVQGFLLVVDDQHLVHAGRRHGSPASEARRGQAGIGRDDFALLPQILGEPDAARPADPGRRGGPAVVITKLIGAATYLVVIEVRTRRRQLSFVTMMKRE